MMAYLLESSLCWLVFYTFYYLFLRKQTFFQYNRSYLLLALLSGLLLPLVNQYLAGQFPEEPILAELPVVYVGWVEPIVFNELGTEEASGVFSWKNFLLGLYLLGLSLFLGRLLYGFYKLWRLRLQSDIFRFNGLRVYETPQIASPFSFFNHIFWSPKLPLKSKEGATIFAHEQAHIRLGHSYDLLLVELLTVFFWFNPIFHFYKKSLRNVHEYQADAAVLEQVPVRPYGQMLLYQARYNDAALLPMGNYFLTKQIKERIMMMTKQPSSKRKLWIYLFAVPTLFFMGMVVFQTEAVAEIPSNETREPVTAVTDPDEMPTFAGCEGETDADKKKQCSLEHLFAYVFKNLKYPKVARNAGQEGMAVVSFTIAEDGQVTDASLVLDPGSGMGEEALRVVKTMPKWNPGIKDGAPVAVEMKLPVKFKLDEEDKKKVYQEVEQLPVFAGCDESLTGEELKQCSNQKMIEFIGKNLVYPKTAAQSGIEGMVVVSFIVEKDGSISEVKGLKGIGGGCDEEVMRVVYSMPNWRPGIEDGKPVRTELKLPVKFVAEQAEKMSQKPIRYELNLQDYRLAPNPTQDQIEINFKGEAGDLQVRIFDSKGQLVFQDATNQFSGFYRKQVNLSEQGTGIYFLQVRQQGKAFIDKIVVQ